MVNFTRRYMFVVGAACLLKPAKVAAAERPSVTVHRDPECGCCLGWVRHIQKSGFVTDLRETKDLDSIKKRLRIPADLAACHTAEIAGYVIEGHVPAAALNRLLTEKPKAIGIAVPGMPVGSPGMEGGEPERYEVVLFGLNERRVFMRFVGTKKI
jgi:hypothetical protein